MPKRWKMVSGSKFGFELLDKDGKKVLHGSGKRWETQQEMEDELDEIQNGEIEFLDGSVKPPRHHRT